MTETNKEENQDQNRVKPLKGNEPSEHTGAKEKSSKHTGTKEKSSEHTHVEHTHVEHTHVEHTGAEHTDAKHTNAEHTGAEHTGAEHTGAKEKSSEHTNAEHTGAEHTGAKEKSSEHTHVEHTGAKDTGAEHTGAEHTDAKHTNAEHTSAEHTGAKHTDAKHTDAKHTNAENTSAEHTGAKHGIVDAPLETLAPVAVDIDMPVEGALVEESVTKPVKVHVQEVVEIAAPVAKVLAPEHIKTVVHAMADEPEGELSIEEIKSASLIHELPGDFDWDADDKAFGNYSDAERKRLESQYEVTLNSITKNEIITGTVVLINTKDVVLNIGYKSDGLVPLSEFRDTPDLKIGDTVDVFVEDQEDKNGQLVLSRKRAKTQKSWDDINKALEMDLIIEGYVKSRTKGGLIVDLSGVEAFLPGSQIDIKPIRDYDIYVGKTMEFKVVKINHEFKNVVVSHKVLIEDDLENQKIDIISKLEKGQVLEGTVKNITAFGVFIDLGGVDGLLHITDISWGRIEHPEEVLKLDQKVNVVVLDFDDDKKRIALGLKQLTPHPWESLDTNIQIGSRVKGRVVTVADYGAFLEIIPGVEGLIHVSEMSWSQHLRSPQEFLKVSDEVEAQILTLDRDERKMSLGIKQLTPDPWVDIVQKYPVASKHHAIVKNMTNFGVFVEIEEGVDGLIHISDLSWSKKINHPHEFTKVGEKLDVVVLEVDADNRRLSLGHKQLEENPWDTFETIFTLDSIHQGTIIKVTDKGAVVALPYGVEGFAPSKHLVKEDGKMAGMDESLEFKIIEFNKDQKRIVISHSKIWEEVKAEEKAVETDKRKKEVKATQTAVKKVKESVEKTTLGDLNVLSALKTELENSEAKAYKAKNTDTPDSE